MSIRSEIFRALLQLQSASSVELPSISVNIPIPPARSRRSEFIPNSEAIADIELAVFGLKQQISILQALEDKIDIPPEYRQRLIRVKDDLYNYSRSLSLDSNL